MFITFFLKPPEFINTFCIWTGFIGGIGTLITIFISFVKFLFKEDFKKCVLYRQSHESFKYSILSIIKNTYQATKLISITYFMVLLYKYTDFLNSNRKTYDKTSFVIIFILLIFICLYLIAHLENKIIQKRIRNILVCLLIDVIIIPIGIQSANTETFLIIFLGIITFITWLSFEFILYKTDFYKNYAGISTFSRTLRIIRYIISSFFIFWFLVIMINPNLTNLIWILGGCCAVYIFVAAFEYSNNFNRDSSVEVEVIVLIKKKNIPYITTQKIEIIENNLAQIVTPNNETIIIPEKNIECMFFSATSYKEMKKSKEGYCVLKDKRIIEFHKYKIKDNWVHFYLINGRNYNVVVLPIKEVKEWVIKTNIK